MPRESAISKHGGWADNLWQWLLPGVQSTGRSVLSYSVRFLGWLWNGEENSLDWCTGGSRRGSFCKFFVDCLICVNLPTDWWIFWSIDWLIVNVSGWFLIGFLKFQTGFLFLFKVSDFLKVSLDARADLKWIRLFEVVKIAVAVR